MIGKIQLYSYFGARYYLSDISIWASVDPLAEKYPYQSPYTYCGWNPVRIIDPDGMDEWEVDKATGNMQNVKKTDNDVLYQTVDGKRTNVKQEFKGIVIDHQKDNSTTRKVDGVDQHVTLTDLFFNTKESSDIAFDFLADNTDVEWSKINADNLAIPGSPNNSLHTSHKNNIEFRGAELSKAMTTEPETYNLHSFSHSHPDDDYNDYTSPQDRNHRNEIQKSFPSCSFTLRYSGKNRSYKDDNTFRCNEVGREHKSKLF